MNEVTLSMGETHHGESRGWVISFSHACQRIRLQVSIDLDAHVVWIPENLRKQAALTLSFRLHLGLRILVV